jgi:uncharacterized membrane protein YfcA
MPEITLGVVCLLAVAGLVAGWVDAVVGGGGLIQLPALLLVPGITPIQAVATNKVGAIAGTAVSAATYYRRVHVDLRIALPMALAAMLAAIGGAAIASRIPAPAFTPIILAACLAVLAYTLARPQVGRESAPRLAGARLVVVACGIGVVIGMYDGMLGPGTGSFLVFSIVGLLGYAFLPASGIAKIVNLATNTGSLIFFVPSGHVVWAAGLAVAAGNLTGGYLGARMAVKRGSGFVRVVFVVVVSVLMLRLAWQMGTELGWW